MHPYPTPENIRQSYGFLMFSGGRERVHWEQMAERKLPLHQTRQRKHQQGGHFTKIGIDFFLLTHFRDIETEYVPMFHFYTHQVAECVRCVNTRMELLSRTLF